jgi:hypothetical protein
MRFNRMFTIVAIVMSLALTGYAKDETHHCAKAKDAACCQADACCATDAGCADHAACCTTAACCNHGDGSKSCDMKDGKACCKHTCQVEKKS